ncbi:MAG TPA: LD-carboxypeptidase, partial [Cytophagaceae bacterium]|nr:LD-carboxypeptidase [Cytophagaceae bacterium]
MYKQPPFLNQNDTVILIAPAKNFEAKEMAASIQLLESWGLNVIEGKHLYKTYYQFAGTDQERKYDLQKALNDPTIKAIFCARGGYGTARIIDAVNFNLFVKNPKWVIGFSDITVLHACIQNHKIQSIHGLMPLLFGTPGYESSVLKLREVL